jgi:hypothetical protein
MELIFKQVAIAGDGKTILGLTEEGKLYYKLGSATGNNGWRSIVMTEADKKAEENDSILRRGPFNPFQ